MGSARAFLFDAGILAVLSVMFVESMLGLRRARAAGWQRSRRVGAVVPIAALVGLLIVWFDDLRVLLGGDRWSSYPDQPRWLLAMIVIAAIVAAVTLVDGAMIRVAAAERRIAGHPDSAPIPRFPRSAPILIAGGAVLAVVSLGVVRLDAADPASPVPPTEAIETVSLAGEPPPVPAGDVDGFADLSAPAPLRLVPLTSAASLETPTGIVATDGPLHFVVIERPGLVRSVSADGRVSDPFLDISDRVAVEADLGLLGVALHPAFESNGRMFLAFATVTDTVVAEFAVDQASQPPSAEFVRDLFVIPHVRSWHQGGRIDFGPDGLLYVAVGDGGDPALSQDPSSLRGAILRIDVDGARPYAIPAGNAFGDRAASEVWAFGLRNPYQFWIDPVAGRVHIGDVGELVSEEISVVALDTAGANLGWPVAEGFGCWDVRDIRLQFGGCDPTGFVEPAIAYGHVPDCAVIAGPVYRGALLPDLNGWGLFADFCSRWIRAYEYTDDGVSATSRWSPSEGSAVTGSYIAFGLDHDGEMLLLTSDRIYRIAPGA